MFFWEVIVIVLTSFVLFCQDLKDYFRSAGEITYANAHTPRVGEGIVEFANRKGMDYALDHKDELELEGKKLKVSVTITFRFMSGAKDGLSEFLLNFFSFVKNSLFDSWRQQR